MEKNSLALLQEKASRVIGTLGMEVLGQRLRRERLAQKLSVRTLGQVSGVGVSSVVRAEAGKHIRPLTLIRLTEAMNIHLERLAATPTDESVATHCQGEEWLPLESAKSQALNDIQLLNSRLAGSQLLPTMLRVTGESDTRSHPGEEFLYVLSGEAIVTVTGKPIRLGAGDSINFWGSEPHSYAPATEAPAVLLSIRVNPKP